MSQPQPYTPQYPTQAEAVVKSDTTRFAPSTIYVGGAGNVNVMPVEGTTAVLYTAPPVGSVLPIMVVQVLSTSTTATALVRQY